MIFFFFLLFSFSTVNGGIRLPYKSTAQKPHVFRMERQSPKPQLQIDSYYYVIRFLWEKKVINKEKYTKGYKTNASWHQYSPGQ
jgi:hypothetical protein